MDFKVAGSHEGITAIQMDLKIDGLPIDLMKKALNQAKEARLHILSVMVKAMPNVRKNLSTLYRQSKIDIDFSKYTTKQIFYEVPFLTESL